MIFQGMEQDSARHRGKQVSEFGAKEAEKLVLQARIPPEFDDLGLFVVEWVIRAG